MIRRWINLTFWPLLHPMGKGRCYVFSWYVLCGFCAFLWASCDPSSPSEKIRFTQDTGCLNDGSVEFCLPAHDDAALIAVREIVPGVRCMQARGRAGCDLDREILCMVETSGLCVEAYGAMTDAGWALVCEVAALDAVREIVPTWYE